MKGDFNNHETAFGDIMEALVELFDAEAMLDKICAELPKDSKADVLRARRKVGKAIYLLDRPWPMFDARVVDDIAQPSVSIADAVREVFADSPFGRVAPN